MRGPINSKSGTCTEGVVVDAAGISGKVGVHYPGRSVSNAGSGYGQDMVAPSGNQTVNRENKL